MFEFNLQIIQKKKLIIGIKYIHSVRADAQIVLYNTNIRIRYNIHFNIICVLLLPIIPIVLL